MRLAALLLLLLVSTNDAEARVIAILFDDSGSMSGRIQLPAFGAQLLVSTLDGRQGEDRLVTARMSQLRGGDPVRFVNIKTTNLQQQAVDQIAAKWPVPTGGTPYQQIEMLLKAIKEIQQPGEQAFFIVLTDGLFNQGGTGPNTAPPPSGAEMKQLFQRYKSELKGPLRAEFVLIGADDSDVRTGVEEQGIRAAFLSTFNGDPAAGRYEITNSAELIETMKNIIAQIAATDRAGQSQFLKRSGNEIAVDSPLSIKRIVAVSVGPGNGALANALKPDFSVADRIDLSSRMLGVDKRGNWAGEQLAGATTHFQLQPALPPGRYQVPFDRPPEDTFLLFQTNAGLRLTLYDADGKKIPPKDGIYRLIRGQAATVGFEVVDRAGDHVVTVPASKLGDKAIFTATIDIEGQRRPFAASVDAQRDQAIAPLPTDQVGSGEVAAAMRVSGFVSTIAEPLKIEIAEVSGSVSLALTGLEDCPTCGEDELRYTVSRKEARKPIGKVVVEATAPIDGSLSLRLENAPPWLTLQDASGTQPLPDQPVKAGQPVRIEALLLAAADQTAFQSTPESLRFTLRAGLGQGPEGLATLTRRIQLLPGAASLLPTGHSQDPTGMKPLTVDLNALEQQSEALDFLLVDALTDAGSGTVLVDSDSYFVRFESQGAGHQIALRPAIRRWCTCLVFLDRGEHRLTITWTGPNGLQSATATGTVFVAPRWSEIGWACAKLALLVIGLAYSLRSLWAWFSARRFPHRSGISVYFGRQEEPLYRHLRRLNWTPPRALLWPILGTPHEVRLVEGLSLRAARGGADILLERSDGAFRIETLNQTIEECRAENSKLKTYKLNWNDSVERRDGGLRRLTLLRRPEDLSLR